MFTDSDTLDALIRQLVDERLADVLPDVIADNLRLSRARPLRANGVPTKLTGTVVDVGTTTADVQLDDDAPGIYSTVQMAAPVAIGNRVVILHDPSGGAHIVGNGSAAFATSGGGLALVPIAVKTLAYSAAVNDFVPCDTTPGAMTLTLPTAPADASIIGAKLVIRGTDVVTIMTGGSDVFNVAGGPTSFTLGIRDEAVLCQYEAATAIWYVLATDMPPVTTTRGDLIYRGAIANERLAKGTAGMFLKQGANDPLWAGITEADVALLTADLATIQAAITALQLLGEVYATQTVSGATTVVFSTARVHKLTMTGNITLALSGAVNLRACGLTLYLVQDGTGSRLVTWPASVKWPNGSAPILTTTPNAIDIVVLESYDGGTTWFGNLAGKKYA